MCARPVLPCDAGAVESDGRDALDRQCDTKITSDLPVLEPRWVQANGHLAGQVIAARFHNAVAEAIVEVCRRVRAEEKLNRVCLSGGTFQNMKLLASTLAGLRKLEFEVFIHAQVPPNDGGIALGQAVIATEAMRAKG